MRKDAQHLNFPVYMQLGIKGKRALLPSIWLDPETVGAASSWSGSYHVLGMGRHFDDYVVTRRTLDLPKIPNFPNSHPYLQLVGKIRATGVTGNIGECIAAIVAKRFLSARTRDIAHVDPGKPFRPTRSPDYLLRVGGWFQVWLPALPSGVILNFPDWLPAESKARTSPSASREARKSAISQLAHYWKRVPTAAGFGLVVTLTYQSDIGVTITVVVPSDRSGLLKALSAPDPNFEGVRGFLHGC